MLIQIKNFYINHCMTIYIYFETRFSHHFYNLDINKISM
jgi:hypothetical protein